MLTENRQEEILRLLTVKGSVTVQELKEQLQMCIRDRYIREWLWNLDSKLTKIFEVSGQFDEKHLDFIFTVSALGWYNDCSN